tara:strand:- start:209 stop:757 length:549 start_codon:yes stop_codon:yes gene_type:complete
MKRLYFAGGPVLSEPLDSVITKARVLWDTIIAYTKEKGIFDVAYTNPYDLQYPGLELRLPMSFVEGIAHPTWRLDQFYELLDHMQTTRQIPNDGPRRGEVRAWVWSVNPEMGKYECLHVHIVPSIGLADTVNLVPGINRVHQAKGFLTYMDQTWEKNKPVVDPNVILTSYQTNLSRQQRIRA